MILYRIKTLDPNAHLLEVSIEIPEPIQPVQSLRLPNWIPGSYLIRDFAKNINDLKVLSKRNQEIELEVVDKSNWQFSTDQAVTICYQVYAWDLSVRSAHFDQTHAFFNGTSTFLEVVGQSDKECQVEIVEADFAHQSNWKVATGMPAIDIERNGFGYYRAENYQALIDYPVEIADFTEIEFEANGIPHKMVLTGHFELDKARLKKDLIKICETELNLFGKPAPIDNYLFQVMVTGSDYGGLEHRNSTALICSRNDLPYPGMTEATDGYLQFLELCSHEYFHTWNVKRIQPKVYQESDLQTPVYTNQLWWFEGITSYYDALILLRAEVIDLKIYLKLLAKQLTRVYRMPGRFKQSVSESSWLTWTKFYQQNEDAPNSIISYYTKGSIIALALDLTIRSKTEANKSLDDILLYLWENYGKVGKGIEDGEIEAICSQVSGIDLTDFFNKYLFDSQDPPLAELFAEFDIEFSLNAPISLEDLGGQDGEQNSIATFIGANVSQVNNGLKLTHVWNQQAAYHAGLSAGDVIIALKNLQISTKSQLEQLLNRSRPGDRISCHYFRRDELYQTEISLLEPPVDRVRLSFVDSDSIQVAKWVS